MEKIGIRKLLITQCNDPLMWYAGMVGQVVPLMRILTEENCFLSQEPAGYSNIVKLGDAEIIKPNLPEGDMGYGKERPCKKCGETKLIQARGLCQTCFSVENNLGTLDTNYPSTKRQKDQVLETEIKAHDEVTRQIIVGLMTECESLNSISRKIMSMLKRRGYTASIKSCNQLKNGKFV